VESDKVILASEKDNSILSGERYVQVLSEIHQRSVPLEELPNKLGNSLSPIEVFLALQVLEDKGYIAEAAPQLPNEVCAYWNTQGMDIHVLCKVLQEKTVFLETLGSIQNDTFKHAFETMGIRISDKGQLRVVVTDDYEHEALRRINEQAIATNQPWMLVKPAGVELWIGPIFLPGETGCWECLKQRLEINFPINTFYQAQRNTRENLPKQFSILPHSLQTAANQTAIEIVKWLYYEKNEQLEGRLVSFNSQALKSESHVLVKRPQCPVCGDSSKQHPSPIILRQSTFLSSVRLGGYREKALEDTIAEYRHHVSPITGVVQELKPYHSIKGAPIYSYSSGHNVAFRSKTLFWMNQHIRSASGGKGKIWSQAKTGALCEAIERYSLTYQGDEYYITGSFNGLGSRAIHPNTCMNYSEKQLDNRFELNQDCTKFYSLVPERFDESLEMHWTAVYSLTEEEFKYLPSSFCWAQYPADDERCLFAYPDSNGCAAGNSIEEAILQGFLELVERDSVAQWWYNMLRKPGVDISSFDEPYFEQLLDYYQSLNRSIYVLDLTTDLGIPTFGALSHRIDEEKENVIFGFGAHLDAQIALERALVELNQILPIANVPESQREQGKYLTTDKNFINWLNDATLDSKPYLKPLEDDLQKTAADFQDLCKPTIYDSVKFCIEKAGEQGLETLVLDMTRKDIGLPVVKVIVPGMRHFWPRLGPGRLYDVPLKMGFVDKKLTEDELNPIGLFI
jgi:ribosomal protein S12 methylthiotransferase accessory factor